MNNKSSFNFYRLMEAGQKRLIKDSVNLFQADLKSILLTILEGNFICG